MKINLAVTVIVVLIWSCSTKKDGHLDSVEYKKEIDAWHAQRVEVDLKGDHGWLNLAGLFWLKEGFNTFGSDSSNDLIFPINRIAANAGTFVLQQGKVTIQVEPGVKVTQDTVDVSELLVFESGMRPPVLRHGALEWTVIERNGKYGVRLRDLESEAVKHFTGVNRFPVDPSWRIEGHFEKYEDSRSIEVTNVLGQTYSQPCPGALVFEIEGKEFRLDAIDEGGDDYFIIFGDRTNATETYPSGRYMYVSPPDERGTVIIDFNKSYNPPCAFTEYATCPLPPRQNVLDVSVLAGEKNYENH